MSTTTAPTGAPRRGAHLRFLGGVAQKWAVFAACALLWQLAAASAQSLFFPTPVEIAATAWRTWLSGPATRLFLTDTAYQDVLPSIGRLLLGWALAAAAGIAGGVLLGRSRAAMSYMGPLLSFARSIPPPTLVPVFLVLFGIGFQMQLATIVFGSVWPILLNSADGTRSVDATKTETARAFRLPRSHWLLGVVLPSALPKIFAGLRVSLALALIMMVISELVGSTNGIGHGIQLARRQFDYPGLWAHIVLLGVLGYLFNTLLLALEKRAAGSRPARR